MKRSNYLRSQGIRPLPEKGEAMETLTPPTNIDEVHHFPELTVYYPRFFPLYTEMDMPLNNLLCNKTPFVWSENLNLCFEQLKEAPSKPPILQHPNLAMPVITHLQECLPRLTKILKT